MVMQDLDGFELQHLARGGPELAALLDDPLHLAKALPRYGGGLSRLLLLLNLLRTLILELLLRLLEGATEGTRLYQRDIGRVREGQELRSQSSAGMQGAGRLAVIAPDSA